MKTIHDLYDEINRHLQNDDKPSLYINEISETELFHDEPFSLLVTLKQTPQSPIHHPEGNVWNHTMLVVDQAAKVKNKSKHKKEFMWAALLHDIGKPDTTKKRKGKITSYDHDKVGAELAKKFLLKLTDDKVFIDIVVNLIRYHMHILFVVNDLPYSDLEGLKQNTDINEVALLGLCDRLGRLNPNIKKEEENISQFIKKCLQ